MNIDSQQLIKALLRSPRPASPRGHPTIIDNIMSLKTHGDVGGGGGIGGGGGGSLCDRSFLTLRFEDIIFDCGCIRFYGEAETFTDIALNSIYHVPRISSCNWFLLINPAGDYYTYVGCGSGHTEGTLVVGGYYIITNYNPPDDFTNVGAASNANLVRFIATGTTPASWTNGSSVGRRDCDADCQPESTGLIAIHVDFGLTVPDEYFIYLQIETAAGFLAFRGTGPGPVINNEFTECGPVDSPEQMGHGGTVTIS